MFQLTLGKEAKKSIDLTIPKGKKNHFKEMMEMVKGREEKYAQTNKFLKQVQKNMKSMPKKHESMSNLRLGNTCGWTSRILRCSMDSPHVSLLSK